MAFVDQMKWIGPALIMAVAVFIAHDASMYRPDAVIEDVPTEHEHIHTCTHGEIMKNAKPPTVVEQNYEQPSDSTGPKLSSHTENKAHLNDFAPISGVSSIRIKFNTAMLYIDSRTCFPGVPYVEVGTAPTGTTYCTGGLENNCWMQCTSDLVFTEQKRQRMIVDLLPFAKDHFERFLAVKSVVGDLTISTNWGSCASRVNGTMVDTVHPNTDLVIVVTARPLFGNTLAQAITCQVDGKGRPTAGWIIYRPDKVMGKLDYVRGVMTHELTHVLGFSYGFVSGGGFINPVTESALALSDVLGWVNRTNTLTDQRWEVPIMKTPKVLEVARAHFDCPTLEGAPLEDQGGGGTQYSHWEKRVFQTEYMTGSSPTYPIYSKLTFAFLQDTGFYFVFWNRTTDSNNLRWGWHEGCTFPTVSCSQWASQPVPKPEYWCSDASIKGCNFDMTGKGSCGKRVFGDYGGNPLSPRYQYFDTGDAVNDPKTGGYDQLPDWCTFMFPYSNMDCEETAENPPTSTARSTGTQYFGETWGTGSRCYHSSLIKRGAGILARGHPSSCHKTICASDTLLKLKIDSDWYDCPTSEPSKVITHNEYTGTIKCPPAWQNPCGKYAAADPDWPLVHSISPTSGTASGGYMVTLIGERFTQGSTMWVLDAEMTNVVIHGSTNATGMVTKVGNIRAAGKYPAFIKDSLGRMASADLTLTPITVSLNQILSALLAFLNDYAVPLVVASISGVCAYSVKKEYEALKGKSTTEQLY